MRNLPKILVERQLKNSSTLKGSLSSLAISDSKSIETGVSSGSLTALFFFKDRAISFSADDFPHNTNVQAELVPSPLSMQVTDRQ